jgi:hypothetical protein
MANQMNTSSGARREEAVTTDSSIARFFRRHRWPDARVRKFRQAAFVYLHVALLYEIGVYVIGTHGGLPTRFGPYAMWLAIGGAVSGAIFAGLYWWRSAWLARIVFVIHAGRLSWAMNGAFFSGPEARLDPALYKFALVVILINLWMLARAGWDL